jgi:D-glycero-alpha-D-manno-heptose 1-phosphate guanylyltransferase
MPLSATSLAEVTAAILAGGRGTRLSPAVADRPKPLAPVQGRPFVTYLLDQLGRAGVREAVLLTGFMAEVVEVTLGETYADLRLRYSVEREPLGTGGALCQALPLLTSPSVLVMNGDSYCGLGLDEFWTAYVGCGAKASMALVQVPDSSRYGGVRVSADGMVEAFTEKRTHAEAGWINAGVYLLDRGLIAEIPPGGAVSLERDIFPGWVGGRLVHGYCRAAPFLDIGTPEAYAEAQQTSWLR